MVGEERTVNGQEMAAGSNKSENEIVIGQGSSCKGCSNSINIKHLIKKTDSEHTFILHKLIKISLKVEYCSVSGTKFSYKGKQTGWKIYAYYYETDPSLCCIKTVPNNIKSYN